MPRCLVCYRRLGRGARCPRDGVSPPDESGESQLPPARPEIAGFTIRGLLGAGGFGAIWDATRDQDGLAVALKVSHLRDTVTTERFRREVEALERVGPPTVPAVYDTGTLPDGEPYLAMEKFSGSTLAAELERWPSNPDLARVTEIYAALLASVEAVHERGVVHRDLKPDNIILEEGPELVCKLIDFGIVRKATPGDAALTQQGAILGTPEYMSPEQFSGRSDVDARADVYALGAILFELLTLRLPFVGQRQDLEYGHLSLRPPLASELAPGVPSGLDDMIQRCLAKEPEIRFADAGALRRAFAGAVALPASTSAPSSLSPSAAPAKPSRPPVSTRQNVALVFLEAEENVTWANQTSFTAHGGLLAHYRGTKYVLAFTHEAGDHPGRRAMGAARALIERGLFKRALLDVSSVVVKQRPDGQTLILSPIFDQEKRYPRLQDPAGVLLTAAVREMLPGVPCEPALGREGCFVLNLENADGTVNRTATLMQVAQDPPLGRDANLAALVEDAEAAIRERRPRVATVLADPGLGKTLLGFELAQRLGGRARVLELAAREPVGGDSDETIRNLLRRTFGISAPLSADQGRALLDERLGELGKEVFAGVGLVMGWISPEDSAVESLRAAPGVLRATIAHAGGEALRRLADASPVVVVLDDAHWADDAVLDTIEQASAGDVPLWVCALARPSFLQHRPTWGQRAAHNHVEHLGPLDQASALDLCRRLLRPATEIPEAAMLRLVERTQAVPLLLTELVRGLKRDGIVRRQKSGGGWYLASEVLDQLPDLPLVEWLASRELSVLPPDVAAHARLASQLSIEFTADEAEGVLTKMDRQASSAFPLDARVGMKRLVSSGTLVLHRNGRLGFRSALLRDAIGKNVGEPLRTQIHRAALEYYRIASGPDAARLPRLAWHAAHAGDHLAAATTYLAVAELARGRHNYLEGELSYTRALAELEASDEARRLAALKGRGIMRYRMDRFDDALGDFASARELARKLGDVVTEADVLLDESMALDWLEEWHASRRLVEEAEPIVKRLSSPLLEARLLQAQGRSASRFNQDGESVTLFRRAAEMAAPLGDQGYEVLVTSNVHLGFVLSLIGLSKEAEERLSQVEVLCQEKGDELHMCSMYNNRSCLWLTMNDRERFENDNTMVLSYARRMGNITMEKNACLNAGYFYYWRGDHDVAVPHVRRMIELDERRFRDGMRPDGMVLLARVRWASGDQAEARSLIEQIGRQQAAARADGKTELLLAPNDRMLFDMMVLVFGDGSDRDWESLVERARQVAQGPELIEVLEIRGLAALGKKDLETARASWRTALDVGERIPNPMGGRIRQRLLEMEGRA